MSSGLGERIMDGRLPLWFVRDPRNDHESSPMFRRHRSNPGKLLITPSQRPMGASPKGPSTPSSTRFRSLQSPWEPSASPHLEARTQNELHILPSMLVIILDPAKIDQVFLKFEAET